jgi:prolyl-tRNA synthetase
MGAFVLNENGEKIYPEMGSYGIGVSRLVAAIIEASHDDHGIIWPEPVAPFDLTLLNLHPRDEKCSSAAAKIYETFSAHQEVLYDDRDISVGEKLADADLMGIPWQIIVGSQNIGNNLVELKNRKTKEVIKMSPENAVKRFISKCCCPQNY